MAVKTTWDVAHECGHSQTHDLSTKPVSERAGLARWLATKPCTECYFAAKDKEDGREPRLDRDAWLAQKRAAEAAETEVFERKTGLGPLDGSEKAVNWARRVRHQLITAAWEELGGSEDEFDEEVVVYARQITGAGWWIDQKDSAPADLPELVSDAVAVSDARAKVSENVA